MKFAEIKVIDKCSKKKVFINGIEQKCVAKVEAEVLPGEITTVKVTYITDKFEIIKDNEA